MKTNIQQMNNYLADIKLTKGLYATINLDKIIRNCDFYEIETKRNHLSIVKRNKISILTFKSDNFEFLQFKIQRNLKISELNKMDNDLINIEVKEMIIKASRLLK